LYAYHGQDLSNPASSDRSGEGWEKSWPFSRLVSQLSHLPAHHRVHAEPFPSPFLFVVLISWNTPEEANVHQGGLRMRSRSFE